MAHPVMLCYGPGQYRPQASATGLAVSHMLDLTNSDLNVWEFPQGVESVIYLGPPHRVDSAPSGNVHVHLNYTVPEMWYPTTTDTTTTTTHTTPTTTTPSGGWFVDWELLWRAIAVGESVDTAWSSLNLSNDVPEDAYDLSDVSAESWDPSWQAGDKVEFGVKRDNDDEWPTVAWFIHLHVHYDT